MNPISPIDKDAQSLNEKYQSWFGDLVGHLGVDQMLLEKNVASTETKKMYDTLIFGKESEIHHFGRVQSSIYFIKGLLEEYFTELSNFDAKPARLALELSDAKILVWAEVNDDDERAEDALILAEAKVNAKYGEYGFHVSSTVVEKSDGLNIPSHYQPVIA